MTCASCSIRSSCCCSSSPGRCGTPSRLAVWLLVPYLLCRLAGKVAGAWVSARFVDVRASDLAAFLMSPGVLAIAFALNFRQLLPGAPGDALLAVAAMGTAAFELFALAVVPHWRRERVLVRRLAALAITIGLAWLVVARMGGGEHSGSGALALGVALLAAVDRRLAVQFLRLPRITGLSRVRSALRAVGRATSSRSRWRAISRSADGLAIVIIAFIAGLQLNVARLRPHARAIGIDHRRHARDGLARARDRPRSRLAVAADRRGPHGRAAIRDHRRSPPRSWWALARGDDRR